MSYFPGWKLQIDGEPAQLIPYNGYLGAKMLPGEHVYQFYYQPTPYYVGATISLLALAFFLGLLLYSPVQSVLQKIRRPRTATVFPTPSS
jgi:hypothetical protein